MISLVMAMRLKEAGLVWEPALHDFFAVPEPGLDQRVFVLSDMTIEIEQLFGWQALTFNGAVEWALDYVMAAEVVWMPTESQLREIVQQHLLAEPQPAVQLISALDGYLCQINFQNHSHRFEAVSACDAYARALLYVLEHEPDLVDRSQLQA